MQSLPLQTGNGLPSARSSMGKAVMVASTRRRRASFDFSEFTGYPLLIRWNSVAVVLRNRGESEDKPA